MMAAPPSASETQRAVGSSSGSPARNRYLSVGIACCRMYAGSCFFRTRIAVGELNIVLTRWSATIFHQIAGSGRIGRPSYMIVVEPLMSGP
jgi:hypothetical protein